jgi:hypothetical protein
MKRALFVAIVCALMSVPAMAGLSWNYNYADGDGTSLTSPYSWATVDKFSGTRPGWTYTGNYAIYTGDVSGKASAPWSVLDGVKDNTPYLAVPKTNQIAPYSVTVDFGGAAYNYLGLHWGSMDNYNQIEFLSGGSVVETINGNQVWLGGPSGGQTVPQTNAYVNFFTTADSAFDSIRINSFSGYGGVSPYAFELDNLAVPVPGAWVLGILGLGTASTKLRRRRV